MSRIVSDPLMGVYICKHQYRHDTFRSQPLIPFSNNHTWAKQIVFLNIFGKLKKGQFYISQAVNHNVIFILKKNTGTRGETFETPLSFKEE